MLRHGLDDWHFEFDSARRRFGSCRYSSRTITLSYHLAALNDESAVRNTVLHEIAHALAGERSGHGKRWRLKARQIGCDAERCYDREPGVRMVAPPYLGVCPDCGVEMRAFRRRSAACLACCRRHNAGRFSDKYLLRWVRV